MQQHQRDKQSTILYKLGPHLSLILVAISVTMVITILTMDVAAEPMVGSTSGGNVHKFHPNGRYGRRSLPLGAGESPLAHTEFGRERSLSKTTRDGQLKHLLLTRNGFNNLDMDDGDSRSMNGLINEMELGNFRQELDKILKCDYTGMANLYYCDL